MLVPLLLPDDEENFHSTPCSEKLKDLGEEPLKEDPPLIFTDRQYFVSGFRHTGLSNLQMLGSAVDPLYVCPLVSPMIDAWL